jgi:hypothetical protein
MKASPTGPLRPRQNVEYAGGRPRAFGETWGANIVFRALWLAKFAKFPQPGSVKIVWMLRVDPIDATQVEGEHGDPRYNNGLGFAREISAVSVGRRQGCS